MTEPAILIGGENDGREFEVSYPHPADRIRIPARLDLVAVITADPTDDGRQPIYAVLDYDLVTGPLGPPSRDDQGRLRYQLRKG